MDNGKETEWKWGMGLLTSVSNRTTPSAFTSTAAGSQQYVCVCVFMTLYNHPNFASFYALYNISGLFKCCYDVASNRRMPTIEQLPLLCNAQLVSFTKKLFLYSAL